jgi:hypothetical protein
MSTSPQVASSAYLVHLPFRLSASPLHITVTVLHPSPTLLLHLTTQRANPRLSDALVLSMPRGNDVVSTKLEGLGGVDDDIDRIARLLGTLPRLPCQGSQGSFGGFVVVADW